jgi:hypothetical protein
MFCLHCGNSMKEEDEKCSFCGQKLNDESVILQEEEKKQFSNDAQGVHESKDNVKIDVQFEKLEKENEKKELLFQDFVDKMDEAEHEMIEGGYSLFEGIDNLVEVSNKSTIHSKEEAFTEIRDRDRIDGLEIQSLQTKILESNGARANNKVSNKAISKRGSGSKKNNPSKNIFEQFDFKKFKKIIFSILVFSICLFLIVNISKFFFKSSLVSHYVEIERKHFEDVFSEIASESLKNKNELQDIMGGNIQRQIRVGNLDLDQQSLSLIGFNPNEVREGLSKGIDIVWDSFQANNNGVMHNDLKLILRNIPLFTLETFMNGSVFYVRFPSVYPVWFRLDSSKENLWTQKMHINPKNSGNILSLDIEGMMARVFIDQDEKIFGSNILDTLKGSLSSKDIKVFKDVQYLYKVGASQDEVRIATDRYQIAFEKKVFLEFLKALKEEVKRNDAITKILADRFLVGVEMIRNLEMDKGHLKDINRESYLRFISNFAVNFNELDLQEKAIMNVWVDKNGVVVGRELQLRAKGKNAEEVFLKVRYSGEGKDFGNRFLNLYLESAEDEMNNMEIVLERVVVKDQFTDTLRRVTENLKYEVGDKEQKGYLFFDFLSSRNFQGENDVDRDLGLKFLRKSEQGDFIFDVKINGKEYVNTNESRASKDLDIIYTISAENSYEGKFNMKVDRRYGDDLAGPRTFDVISGNNEKTIDLNEVNMDDVYSFITEFQLQYMNYKRRTYERFGLEFFPNLGMSH